MVMPCATAATTQMEATRMDNNFIFEKRLRREYGVRVFFHPSVNEYPLFMGALLGQLSFQVGGR